MILKISTIILTVLFSFLQGDATDFYAEKQAKKMVMIVLKNKNIKLLNKVEINGDSGKNEHIVIYRFIRTENNKMYYVAFTQAKGRYDLFDYLVVTDTNFTVEKVSVLKYRSEHGGEIASKKWLSQFENYSTGDLRYGKEVSALSGATISANSITADIPKVLEILKKSSN